VSSVPSLSYVKIIAALQRLGFVVVRQKGSHIRLQKHLAGGDTVKITVPAHKPVLRSTLGHILKQAKVTLDDFLKVVLFPKVWEHAGKPAHKLRHL
jgi:predicted RNA binding protein YcfA (HicA-like mRNA interferase family)